MSKKLYVLRNGIIVKDLGDGNIKIVSVPPNYVDEWKDEPLNAGMWKPGAENCLIIGGEPDENDRWDPLKYKGGAWGRKYDVVAAFDESASPQRTITKSFLKRYTRWLFGGRGE